MHNITPKPWEEWLAEGTARLHQSNLLRSLRPITLQDCPSFLTTTNSEEPAEPGFKEGSGADEERRSWHTEGIEVEVPGPTMEAWLEDRVSTGEEPSSVGSHDGGNRSHRLKLFSGNDYMGLASHPRVRGASAEAVMRYGMGPRSSALVCGYTHLHRQLETAVANLCNTEECLLCPSGFSANMAVMTALASPAPSKLSTNQTTASSGDSVAIFSDAWNHASIIDGVRLVQRQGGVAVHVYRHNDVAHLEELLARSAARRKMVVSDSLFSMDGDFAPVRELAALRRKHGFLLVLDEAHATLVCGERGGGAAEAFGIEDEVDVHVGTLSKAMGCHGGFIACSRAWKQWILSRGRSFVFSTALPVPVVAAALAAIEVARQESWRQRALWANVRQLSRALGVPFASPICPIVIGGAQEALTASRELLKAGFHVAAIRPPTVPANSSRLRVALSASHTREDIDSLVAALPPSLRAKGGLRNPFRGVLPLTWSPPPRDPSAESQSSRLVGSPENDSGGGATETVPSKSSRRGQGTTPEGEGGRDDEGIGREGRTSRGGGSGWVDVAEAARPPALKMAWLSRL